MASKGGFVSQLRQFDAYPKTLDDVRIKTLQGGLVSIISIACMLILFFSELSYFLQVEVQQQLLVDTSRGDKLRINIDVTFPRMSCAYLSVDVMDISGEQQFDLEHSLFKKRLNLEGQPITETEDVTKLGDESADALLVLNRTADENYCGSCYGAESPSMKCCNTCEDIRTAYRLKGWAFANPDGMEQCTREGWSDKLKTAENEGCNVYGYLEVNKVAGNFHFAPGKSFQQHHVHIHDLQSLKTGSFNLSHVINRLSFGKDYPGMHNPLDGVEKVVESKQGSAMFQYFLKLVPTEYNYIHGEKMVTNQYSVTQHFKMVNHASGEAGLPGVFFIYDLSAMLVRIVEVERGFFQFLTSVCAIVGGVFTVAGIVDGFLYHSLKNIKQKDELGKLG